MQTIKFILRWALYGLALVALMLLYRQYQQHATRDYNAMAPHGGVYSYAKAVQKALPSVVNIYTARNVSTPANRFYQQFWGGRSHSRLATGLGSGVIINSHGYILTNYHVIKNAQSVHVLLHDGRDFQAQLIGKDSDTDLAVLKIDSDKLAPIRIDPKQTVQIGDVALAIGNPFGVGQTVTMGIISATGRDRLGLSAFENFIQTDAAINPGNSGGALVDSNGTLVGINTAIFSQDGGNQGIGFSIPANTALDVFQQISSYGKVIRGWIGATGRDLPAALMAKLQLRAGALIESVAAGGPADVAGLQAGDIITHLNSKEIINVHDVLNQISAQVPGSILDVGFIRQQQAMHSKIMIIERPQLD